MSGLYSRIISKEDFIPFSQKLSSFDGLLSFNQIHNKIRVVCESSAFWSFSTVLELYRTRQTAIWNPILFINGLSKVILHCKLHRLKNNISRTHNFQSLLISVAGYGCENLSDAFHFQIKATKIQRIFRFAEFISVYHNSSRNRSNIALLVW